MRRALYASSGLHLAVVLWALLGGQLFRDSDEPEFEVTGVTLLSNSEFDAMFNDAPSFAVTDAPTAPSVEPQIDTPDVFTPEAAAPDAVTPDASTPPPAEIEPRLILRS